MKFPYHTCVGISKITMTEPATARNFDDTFSRFDTTLECDRQSVTDRRKDGQTDRRTELLHQYRAHVTITMASSIQDECVDGWFL